MGHPKKDGLFVVCWNMNSSYDGNVKIISGLDAAIRFINDIRGIVNSPIRLFPIGDLIELEEVEILVPQPPIQKKTIRIKSNVADLVDLVKNES